MRFFDKQRAALYKADEMGNQHGNILTIDELSKYLKVSKSTLYKLAQDEKLPGQKVGRHWRFNKEAIDLWLGEKGKTTNKKT